MHDGFRQGSALAFEYAFLSELEVHERKDNFQVRRISDNPQKADKRRNCMGQDMSSRERMLSAINHQEPDHVPLYLHFGSISRAKRQNSILPFTWNNQFERVEQFQDVLGIDDILAIEAPSALNLEKVTARVTKQASADGQEPLLIKEYETPEGMLRQVVRQTPDWPYGDDIPFKDDYLIPRSREFLVKEREDIDKLKCLLRAPASEEIEKFRNEAARIKRFADERQVLVEGHVDSVGTAGCHLVGMAELVLKAVSEPGFASELFDVLHEWEMAELEILLDSGVADVVVVNGFYESLQLWSPQLFRRFFFRPLREKINVIHQRGAKCAYNMTSQLMPLAPVFRELGFDILRYLDPVKGEPNLAGLKKEIGDILCFLGGVNGAITVGRGSIKEVKEATLYAIKVLAPGGGLILSAADAIYEDAPLENAMVMIDTWRKAGTYPIAAI